MLKTHELVRKNFWGEIIMQKTTKTSRKTTEKQDVKYASYEALTLRAIEELYERTEEPLQVKDLSLKVAEYRNQEKVKYKYDADVVQSSVSRSLKILVARKKVAKIGSRQYIPNNKTAVRKHMRKILVKEVRCFRSEIFMMSPTTLLIPVKRESMDSAKRLFQLYLGEDGYDVIEYDKYLAILLAIKAGNPRYRLILDIKDLVEKAFEYKPEEPPIRLEDKPARLKQSSRKAKKEKQKNESEGEVQQET